MKRSELARYTIELSSYRSLCPTRYWNTNGFAGAVVATLTFRRNDNLLDWAAYIGGCDLTQYEEDAERWVAEHGAKISRGDAEYYFPDLPISLYRG